MVFFRLRYPSIWTGMAQGCLGLWICIGVVGVACRSGVIQLEETEKRALMVIDAVGRTVSLHVPATRIASLSPGATEALFAMDCGSALVLRDRWSLYPEAAIRLPMTDGANPSVDAIAGFRPDLVILYFSDDRHVRLFTRLSIPVLILDPKSYDEVAADIEKLGVLCGRRAEARQLADSMRQRRDAVVSGPWGSDPLRVYVEVDGSEPARPWTAGTGSFVDELLTLSGGRNVFGTLPRPFVRINVEEIISASPDVVLLAGLMNPGDAKPERLLDRPGFGTLAAVRDGRVISHIHRDLLTIPGPRLAEGLSQLHEALKGQRDGRY